MVATDESAYDSVDLVLIRFNYLLRDVISLPG